MPVTKCVVDDCKTSLSLLSMPRGHDMREVWLQLLAPHASQLRGKLPTDLVSQKVCLKHFESQFLRYGGTRPKKLYNAYPTLFTHDEILSGRPIIAVTLNDNTISDEHSYSRQDSRLDHTYSCNSRTKIKLNQNIDTDVADEVVLSRKQDLDEPTNIEDAIDPSFLDGIEEEPPTEAIFSWQKEEEILYPTGYSDVLMGCEQDGCAPPQELGDVSLYDDEPSQDTHHDKHVEYQCNVCEQEIIGFRYTCVQCVDWDLCSACEANGAHHAHYVLRVPGPRPYNEIQAVMNVIRQQLLSENLFLTEQIIEDSLKLEPEDELFEAAQPPAEPDPLRGDLQDNHMEPEDHVLEAAETGRGLAQEYMEPEHDVLEVAEPDPLGGLSYDGSTPALQDEYNVTPDQSLLPASLHVLKIVDEFPEASESPAEPSPLQDGFHLLKLEPVYEVFDASEPPALQDGYLEPVDEGFEAAEPDGATPAPQEEYLEPVDEVFDASEPPAEPDGAPPALQDGYLEPVDEVLEAAGPAAEGDRLRALLQDGATPAVQDEYSEPADEASEAAEPTVEPDPLQRLSHDDPTVEPDPLQRLSHDDPMVEPDPLQRLSHDDPMVEPDPLQRLSHDDPTVEPDPLQRLSHDDPTVEPDPLQRLSHDDPTVEPDPLQRLSHDDPTVEPDPLQRLSHDDPTVEPDPLQRLSHDDPTPPATFDDKYSDGSESEYRPPLRKRRFDTSTGSDARTVRDKFRTKPEIRSTINYPGHAYQLEPTDPSIAKIISSVRDKFRRTPKPATRSTVNHPGRAHQLPYTDPIGARTRSPGTAKEKSHQTDGLPIYKITYKNEKVASVEKLSKSQLDQGIARSETKLPSKSIDIPREIHSRSEVVSLSNNHTDAELKPSTLATQTGSNLVELSGTIYEIQRRVDEADTLLEVSDSVILLIEETPDTINSIYTDKDDGRNLEDCGVLPPDSNEAAQALHSQETSRDQTDGLPVYKITYKNDKVASVEKLSKSQLNQGSERSETKRPSKTVDTDHVEIHSRDDEVTSQSSNQTDTLDTQTISNLVELPGTIYEIPGDMDETDTVLEIPDNVTFLIEEAGNDIINPIDTGKDDGGVLYYLHVPPDSNDDALAQALHSQANEVMEPLVIQWLQSVIADR